MAKMEAGQAVIEALGAEGVEYIFGLVGTTTNTMVTALHGRSDIRFLDTRHEEGAAFTHVEMDELLRRGTTKDERTDDVDAARVKGLGVQGIAGQHGGAGREIMEGVGLSDDEEDERRRAAIGQKRSREMVEVPPPPRAPLRMTDKELRKEKKRAKKEAKKAKKRAKKEAKRAKKDAKRRSSSSSSSSSS